MKRLFLAAALLTTLCVAAQDPRERVYNYEVLRPSHEIKPRVEGFATERIVERFDRGLTARLSEDGKGIYLNWRLLADDPQDARFHIYRRTKGHVKRLTSRPVTRTTDFIDRHPVNGPAEYRAVPAGTARDKEASQWIAADFRVLQQAPRYTSFRTKGDVGKLGIGDLDGDGAFEYIVRTPATGVDPGVQGRHYDSVYTIAAYRRDAPACGATRWVKGSNPECGIHPMRSMTSTATDEPKWPCASAPTAHATRRITYRTDMNT